MNILNLHSKFRGKDILVIDDCGCKGGIREEEITQHGFRGASWVIGHVIKCNDCNKVLKELPNVQVSDTTEAASNSKVD